MNFCTECGTKLEDNNQEFCPSCGVELKSKASQKTVTNSDQPLTFHLTKQHKLIALSLVVVIALVFGGFKFVSYWNSPERAAKNFIGALMDKNYNEVYTYFTDVPDKVTEEMVVNSLKSLAENNMFPVEMRVMDDGVEKVRYTEGEISKSDLKDENKAFIPIYYKKKDDQEDSKDILSFVKDENGDWKMPFFIPIYEVTFYAPQGTKVLFGGKEVGVTSKEKDNELYLDTVLEGKYTLEMQYPNNIVAPYKEDVYVSYNEYYSSPVQTYYISIRTLPNVEVTFDGNKVENNNGYINISDVFEAEHNLELVLNNMTKPIKQKINVDRSHTYFSYYDFEPSDSFKQELIKVINGYNEASTKAINDKDVTLFKPYVTEDMYNDLEYDYDNFWYKYTKSDYKLTPGKLNINSKDKVYFTVTENWNTTVESLTGQTFYPNYETVLERKQEIEWQYVLVRENGTWKISNHYSQKNNKQYLDKNGNWTVYY